MRVSSFRITVTSAELIAYPHSPRGFARVNGGHGSGAFGGKKRVLEGTTSKETNKNEKEDALVHCQKQERFWDSSLEALAVRGCHPHLHHWRSSLHVLSALISVSRILIRETRDRAEICADTRGEPPPHLLLTVISKYINRVSTSRTNYRH